MGIAGLLGALKSIVTKVHISEYRGLRVAVDAHCWLHRAGYSCCKELAEGIATTKFVDSFMDHLEIMIRHGVTPVVVFDGRPLPAKLMTNKSRRISRTENTSRAREAEAEGRLGDAYSYYQKSVSVTPDMVFQIITALREKKVEFIVSPYESDAELAFLSLSGNVDVVLTEDSDALVYGCRRVLYKFDKDGNGQEIRRRSLGANQSLSFLNWSDDQFKLMCCVAGCDYAPKIRNIGLVTAHRFVDKHKNFKGVINALRASTYKGIDDEYIAKLRMAMNTFKHQTVYNPSTRAMQPLTPFSDSVPKSHYLFDSEAAHSISETERKALEGLGYLGEVLPAEESVAIAEGRAHPTTLQPISIPDKTENDPIANEDAKTNIEENVSRNNCEDDIIWTEPMHPDRGSSRRPQEISATHTDRDGEVADIGMWSFNFKANARLEPKDSVSSVRYLEKLAGGGGEVGGEPRRGAYSEGREDGGRKRSSGSGSSTSKSFVPVEVETLQRRKKRRHSHPLMFQGTLDDAGIMSGDVSCVSGGRSDVEEVPLVCSPPDQYEDCPPSPMLSPLVSPPPALSTPWSPSQGIPYPSSSDRSQSEDANVVQNHPFRKSQSPAARQEEEIFPVGLKCFASVGMIKYRPEHHKSSVNREYSNSGSSTGASRFSLPKRGEENWSRHHHESALWSSSH